MVRLFGTTIKETLSAFEPVHLGAENSGGENDKIKAIGRIVITFALMAFAFYSLVFTDQDPKLPSGIIGTITGYWLK